MKEARLKKSTHSRIPFIKLQKWAKLMCDIKSWSSGYLWGEGKREGA